MAGESIIQDLFEFSLSTFNPALFLVKCTPVKDNFSADPTLWKEEKDRLTLWGDGFDVERGELDQILSIKESEHLRKSVVMLLGTISGSLARLFNPIATEHEYIRKNLVDLSAVVKEVDPDAPDLFYDYNEDEYMDLVEAEQLKTTLEEITEANNALFDLVPFIEEVYSEHGDAESDGEFEDAAECTLEISPSDDHGSYAYRRNIMDKFPKISITLADTLAKLNWLRYQRVREIGEAVEFEKDIIPRGTVASFMDSAYYSLPAILQLPSSGVSVAHASESSVATSKPETSGHARIPKPPVDLFSDAAKSFTCNICFKTVTNIDNRQKWKKHVLRDLQPYSCLHEDCPSQKTTFPSRTAWMEHEATHVQTIIHWKCAKGCKLTFESKDSFMNHILDNHLRGVSSLNYEDIEDLVVKCEIREKYGSLEKHNCPFCETLITGGRTIIQRHIGHHLEEIALKVLPAEEDSDSELESENSSNPESVRSITFYDESSDITGHERGQLSKSESNYFVTGAAPPGMGTEEIDPAISTSRLNNSISESTEDVEDAEDVEAGGQEDIELTNSGSEALQDIPGIGFAQAEALLKARTLPNPKPLPTGRETLGNDLYWWCCHGLDGPNPPFHYSGPFLDSRMLICESCGHQRCSRCPTKYL